MNEQSGTNLIGAISRLRFQWSKTRAVWQDEVAQQFERATWNDLDQHIDCFSSAIKELEKELSYIENDLDSIF